MSQAPGSPAGASSPAPAPAAPQSQDAPVQAQDAALEGAEGGEGEEGLEAEAPKNEPPKSTKKKLKLKVDGEEFEEEYDPNDEDYMRKTLQMAKMANKRAKTAAEYEQKLNAIGNYLEQAKGDKKVLRELIKQLGADEKELAAMIIEEEIERSKLTPEQIRQQELENELRELKAQREREKEEFTRQEFDRLQQQEMERYDVLMSQSLEKSDLPKSPYVVKKMADYMLMGLEAGVELTPDDVIPMLREEIQEDIRQMFAVMPEETIEKLIGNDTLKKLRKKNVAKAKATPVPPQPLKSAIKDVGADKPAPKEAPKKINYKDFFKV